MLTARSLVLDYLQNLTSQGLQRLPIDDDAKGILRAWMLAARNGTPLVAGAPAPAPVGATAAVASAAGPATAPQAGAPAQDLSSQNRQFIDSLYEDLETEVPNGASQEEDGDGMPFFRPGGNSPEEVWGNFARLLPNWKPLRELGTLRPTPVPGAGNRQAAIMFVGDAPNYYDEKAGVPFQGEAGSKLDGMLKAMGLDRRQIYLTHLVKFRPSLPRQTTNNRPPNEKEIRFSVPILDLEARLVRPRVIVALGVIAARGMLGGELPLSAYLQQQGQFCGIPVVVTHHPSYLLRTSDLKERRRLWEDMLRVMAMAGLPISPRQQSYFLK